MSWLFTSGDSTYLVPITCAYHFLFSVPTSRLWLQSQITLHWICLYWWRGLCFRLHILISSTMLVEWSINQCIRLWFRHRFFSEWGLDSFLKDFSLGWLPLPRPIWRSVWVRISTKSAKGYSSENSLSGKGEHFMDSTLWIIPAEWRCLMPHNIWYSR